MSNSFPAPPPAGVYTPVPTFFTKDGVTIDFETQVRHAKFLSDNGIKGAVIMGSTGEAAHLTRTERASIISSIHRAVPHWVIVGGVSQNSVQDALDEIDSIMAAGASYALVLSSSYYGPGTTQAGIRDFYTTIADRSPLPVLIYVYPGVSNGLVVEPTTVEELSSHPNIVGCKLSYGDVSHHTLIASSPRVKINNFNVFTGLGQILLPVLMVGGKGTVDALAGAFPRLYVKIFDLFQEHKYEEAARLQYIACRGEELVVRFGVVGIKKAIHSQGFGETYLGRVPLNHDVDEKKWSKYAANLLECEEVEEKLSRHE
ncbi:DEKNAAC103964 [Brettanomyces naardenensis]|uniref:DEKNAAC103964 n=1 Tax=Brettanomyces naardenensis TaxID=13370 RepID=A0A448YPL5_BRENA|nr:DEKNAAC103964 [Brettanomyces naardenensis]